MSASKIVVLENIEIPVVEGRRARNKNKPKPKNNNSKIIKRNGMGWVEREEKLGRQVGDAELTKMLILERAADKDVSPEPITSDGVIVADTEKPDRSRAPETNNRSHSIDGVIVADTEKRLNDLETLLSRAIEDLAYALRKLSVMEKKLEKLSPVIEKEETKRDAVGLKKLRDDLYKLLKEKMEKTHTNGIYVHSLYGPNGRPGGKLGISKKQAFRLRDACRSDSRFRVEKANNQRGNWAIMLNIHIN